MINNKHKNNINAKAFYFTALILLMSTVGYSKAQNSLNDNTQNDETSKFEQNNGSTSLRARGPFPPY